MSIERLAVLDIGSNSLRVFCCEGVDSDGPVGRRWTSVVGLRRGASPDGTLRPDALGRLREGLLDYRTELRRFAPARTIAVCTSAVRDAPNRGAVVELIETVTGAECHVLSGQDEAALAFAGAALAVDPTQTVTVIDVGGGSTELVTGINRRPRIAVSMPLGAVRQTERHLHSDPPTSAELGRVEDDVRREWTDAGAGGGPFGCVLAVAGTATTLAAIDLGAYDAQRVHGHRLSRGRLTELAAILASMPFAKRRTLPGLQPERAAVITAGAVILNAILGHIDADEVVMSERDLLDGVALAATGGALGAAKRIV